MNIFGIGGAELILILLIMLIVAGPKRMIAWSYTLGKYIAKLRQMWEETVDVLQKELDQAGVDIKVPRELPTRANLNRQAGRALSSVTRPVQDVLDEVSSELKGAQAATTATARQTAETVSSGNGSAAAPRSVAPQPTRSTPPDGPKPRTESFGTWSRTDSDGSFGTWSVGGADSQQK